MDAANRKTSDAVDPVVAEVVELMSDMVSPDSGKVTLKRYDEQGGVLELFYRRGANPDCISCEVTDELLIAFTGEALKTRGINVSKILVEPSTEQ
jgi:hypothetical protein